MANIINVDYDAIPAQAAQMRSKGKEINSEILSAYKAIEEMHNSWYGQRYNELVAYFNEVVPAVNEYLELVVNQIPFTLEQVARNYALADRGDASITPKNEQPQRIATLNISSDVGMRFQSEGVKQTQLNVQKNFKNSMERMSEYESEFARISWESDAAESFRARFKQLKTKISDSFERLNSIFAEYVNKAESDASQTDNANRV